MITGNGGKSSAFAGAAGQVVVGDIQENLFVLGVSFSTIWRLIVPASPDVMDIIWDATAFTGTQITFNPITIESTGGPVHIDYFAGVTESGDGTLLPTINRRTALSGSNQAIITVDPLTVSIVGALNYFSTFAGSGAKVGGDAAGGSPVEVIPSLKYLLRLANQSNQPETVSIDATWFEIP